MNKLKLVLLLVSVLLLTYGASDSKALEVVVPNANEFVEGDGFNSFPFNETRPMRYQQIYESTQFSQCGNIVQVNFRYDEDRTGSSVTYPDILIQLSTTTVTPATLSSTFAANIGPNVTTVYDGELSFSAPTCSSEPCPFDSTITLQTPFRYNPIAGNLLLDVTKPASPSYVLFDADNDALPITARVFNNGDSNAEMGTISDTALVTQFVCEPVVLNVPTLSEWGLIAMAGVLGIVGLLVLTIRRRKAVA